MKEEERLKRIPTEEKPTEEKEVKPTGLTPTEEKPVSYGSGV